ncbi:hypothetical protein [Pseudomonas viridiflava]|uniref:hypothetical protein n=1 Tax=Pseudomonas viridiflava TaxID=33069 RepID=UPI0031F9770D
MSGLALSGLNGGFCSLEGGGGTRIDLGSSDQTGQTVALNSDGWAFDYIPVMASAPINAQNWPQPPPRYLWPSLNPRAPPGTFLAGNPSV